MFLRSTKRKKDGKEHRYWSVVESIRQTSGPVHQKTLLYLGELNDSEQASWTKALEIFNADSGQGETRSLFPSDRTPPVTDTSALSLRLADYKLSHPRQYGACWLTCDLWRQLGLDQFWEKPRDRQITQEVQDWGRKARTPAVGYSETPQIQPNAMESGVEGGGEPLRIALDQGV